MYKCRLKTPYIVITAIISPFFRFVNILAKILCILLFFFAIPKNNRKWICALLYLFCHIKVSQKRSNCHKRG